MAGDFAKIYNTVWTNPDFRALTRGQQWLYWALISQPELTYAGVLTTTERRLTGCAADFTVDELRDDLAVLEKRNFIVVDDEHDEIFVRTYIKWDDAWRTPNVLVAILRAATAVRSPRIRARLAGELERLDVASMDGKRAEEMRQRVAGTIRTLTPRVPATVPERVNGRVGPTVTERIPEGLGEPFGEPLAEPIGEPSVVVAVVGEEVKDRTSVTLPQDSSPPSESEREGVLINLPVKPTYECGSDQDPDFVAFWKNYPRKVGKPSARTAWRKAIKAKVDPQLIIEAAAEFRDDPERRRSPKRFTPHPATWLNDDRYLPPEDDEDEDDAWTFTGVREMAPAEFN